MNALEKEAAGDSVFVCRAGWVWGWDLYVHESWPVKISQEQANARKCSGCDSARATAVGVDAQRVMDGWVGEWLCHGRYLFGYCPLNGISACLSVFT
jgi:hypothetical protein